MSTNLIFPFIALLGFGLLGIFHKIADHPQCRPRMITMLLLLWAAVLTAIYTLTINPTGFHHVPLRVIVIGAAAGVLSSLALFSFQASLRYGKISTSWLILNLSVGVPVAISVLAYAEKVTIAKGVGLLLVLAAILLLWWDKKRDLERTGADSHGTTRDSDLEPIDIPLEGVPDPEPRSGGTMVLKPAAPITLAARSKWLPLILLAFLANGLAASSQKVIGVGSADYTWQYLVILYAAGSALFALAGLMQTGWPNLREIITASVMAIASVTGNLAMVTAMSHKVPGSIAYPVGNGGSLFLVVLAGVLLFKERVSAFGLAGIGVGIAAVLVLMMG
jgi:drug/metabolite transporter (DMT)-like permease